MGRLVRAGDLVHLGNLVRTGRTGVMVQSKTCDAAHGTRVSHAMTPLVNLPSHSHCTLIGHLRY